MLYYLTHPKLRNLFLLVGIFVLIGVIVFSALEGWGFVDSLYFTVATVTTVGFGDLVPTHPASKLLASFYMILTVPMILISIGLTTEAVRDFADKEDKNKKL